ncbi:DUF4903 domain-containing protein, partial [Bacteroides thetaiotaomicron]
MNRKQLWITKQVNYISKMKKLYFLF